MPVLLGSQRDELDPAAISPEDPQCAFSVIVISQNDEATIAASIAAIVTQQCPEPFEVILVTSGTDRTAEIVRTQFPQVKVIALPKPALPGEARNIGLRAATGRYVTFPGSHVVIRPGNLAARLESHRRGYAMVTGLVENGTRTSAGWASYFLDHSEGMPGQPSAVLNGPPAHCSYARLPLMDVGGFPEGVRTAEDTMVNRELVRRGYAGYRNARVRFEHRSPCITWHILIRHHFARGRGWGRLAVMDHQDEGHLITRDFLASRLISHIPSRLRRIDRGVSQTLPELREHYPPVRIGVLAGVIAGWAGMWREILQPGGGKLSILLGQPRQTALVATSCGTPSAQLVQIDHVNRRVNAKALSTSLLIPASSGEQVTLESLISNALAPSPPAPAPDGIQSTTQLLNGFFDIDNLEYLIARNKNLPELIAPSHGGSRLLHSLALVTRLTRTFWRLKTGKLVTSMSAWELIQFQDALSRVAHVTEEIP
jgi:glycosyltransferase involved in cell wall biosynthesis